MDGCGHLLGDSRGGFWIGRRGLEAVLRDRDGRTAARLITARAAGYFGDLDSLVEWIYPCPDAVATIAG